MKFFAVLKVNFPFAFVFFLVMVLIQYIMAGCVEWFLKSFTALLTLAILMYLNWSKPTVDTAQPIEVEKEGSTNT